MARRGTRKTSKRTRKGPAKTSVERTAPPEDTEHLRRSLSDILLGLDSGLESSRSGRLFANGIDALEVDFDAGGTTRVRLGSPAAGTASNDDFQIGQKVPNKAETSVVGAATSKIKRDTPEFATLVKNSNADIVFKDEENTSADRMMTPRLESKLNALATKVKAEWSGVRLRVTEAWDENSEHGTNSVHYEARAADLTTFPVDGTKLGRLARLAVEAGLDWVFYEDANHVHVSMSK